MPPCAAASHTSSNSSARDLGPHDRFVGSAQRREHAGQPLLLLFGPRLLVGAIEIAEREGNVVGQPLQQFDEFRGERVQLGGDEEHHADGSPSTSSGKAAPDLAPSLSDHLLKGLPWGSEEIVADAGLPRTERGSAEAAAFRMGSLVETFSRRALAAVGPAAATTSRQSLAGLDSRMLVEVEPAAIGRRLAYQFVQFGARLCPHDGLVGRAQRRIHARQAFASARRPSPWPRHDRNCRARTRRSRRSGQQRDDLLIPAQDRPTKNNNTPTLCPA